MNSTPELSSDLFKQSSTEEIVGRINGIFTDENNFRFLHTEGGEPNQPIMFTIGGRLFGYDPKHSVGVQIDSCVYEKIGRVRRVEIVDMDRRGVARASYLATDDEIIDGLTRQPLDQTEKNNLNHWLNETRWNAAYTEILSHGPLRLVKTLTK